MLYNSSWRGSNIHGVKLVVSSHYLSTLVYKTSLLQRAICQCSIVKVSHYTGVYCSVLPTLEHYSVGRAQTEARCWLNQAEDEGVTEHCTGQNWVLQNTVQVRTAHCSPNN